MILSSEIFNRASQVLKFISPSMPSLSSPTVPTIPLLRRSPPSCVGAGAAQSVASSPKLGQKANGTANGWFMIDHEYLVILFLLSLVWLNIGLHIGAMGAFWTCFYPLEKCLDMLRSTAGSGPSQHVLSKLRIFHWSNVPCQRFLVSGGRVIHAVRHSSTVRPPNLTNENTFSLLYILAVPSMKRVSLCPVARQLLLWRIPLPSACNAVTSGQMPCAAFTCHGRGLRKRLASAEWKWTTHTCRINQWTYLTSSN